MKKKNLLVVSFTNAAQDPRVWRQAKYLSEDFKVTVAGLGDPGLERVSWIPVEHCPAKTCFHRFWRAGNLLVGNSSPFLNRFRLKQPNCLDRLTFDIVLVNDAEPLPLGFKLAKSSPVVFDAHEYYPRQHERSLTWRVFHKNHITRLCKKFIPLCTEMTTVSNGFADAYFHSFKSRPHVVLSAPSMTHLSPNPTTSNRIRIVHHGVASPARQIEKMVYLADMLDSRFSLDLMLVGHGSYYDYIHKMAEDRPYVGWRAPVPMPQISCQINQYDIGLFIMPPTTFNLRNTIPNKLFEFIQARLAIAIGPSKEMADIVRKHDLGIVGDDFTPQALAARLNALTAEDIMRFKHNSDRAAAIYNAEAEMAKLRTLLLGVLEECK